MGKTKKDNCMQDLKYSWYAKKRASAYQPHFISIEFVKQRILK